jgi:hypothetical protein
MEKIDGDPRERGQVDVSRDRLHGSDSDLPYSGILFSAQQTVCDHSGCHRVDSFKKEGTFEHVCDIEPSPAMVVLSMEMSND